MESLSGPWEARMRRIQRSPKVAVIMCMWHAGSARGSRRAGAGSTPNYAVGPRPESEITRIPVAGWAR